MKFFIILVITTSIFAQSQYRNKFMEYGVIDYHERQTLQKKSGISNDGGLYISSSDGSLKKSQLHLRMNGRKKIASNIFIMNSSNSRRSVKLQFLAGSDLRIDISAQRYQEYLTLEAGEQIKVPIIIYLINGKKQKRQFYVNLLSQKKRVLHEVPGIVLVDDR